MESLYQKLMEYSNSDYYPFHMPGHKRQDCLEDMTMLSEMHSLDITEIEGFDNLHQAEGILKEAQQRAASMYGAEETFFLVNGSTCGILSAISAVAKDGKKLLVARNCHKAVHHGILLNRTEVEYIWPDILEEYDIQGPVPCDQVEEAIRKNRDISGIILTSPTYDGIVSNIREICKVAHQYGLPVIVDEAHGAHFAFHEDFPESAVKQGADIVIHSTHKTLPAFTQTALLHVQGGLIDRSRLKDYLGIYQTSSPSYLLMASMDGAMAWIEKNGSEGFEPLMNLRKEFDEKCRNLKHIEIMPWIKGENDPGKLIISVKNTDMSGQELYQLLFEKYQIQMEMVAPTYVLGIVTPMDTVDGIHRLTEALNQIDHGIAEAQNQRDDKITEVQKQIDDRISIAYEKDKKLPFYHTLSKPQCKMTLWDAYQKEKQWESLENAVGRICGKMISLYPPGIPILLPGEEIGEIHVNQIKDALALGMKVHGVAEGKKICIICS